MRLNGLVLLLAALMLGLTACATETGRLQRLSFHQQLPQPAGAPIAAGSRYTIHYAPTKAEEPPPAVTVAASNPEVLAIVRHDAAGANIEVEARKEGEIELRVLQADGKPWDILPITVEPVGDLRLIDPRFTLEDVLQAVEQTSGDRDAVLTDTCMQLSGSPAKDPLALLTGVPYRFEVQLLERPDGCPLRYQNLLKAGELPDVVDVTLDASGVTLRGLKPGASTLVIGATGWSGSRTLQVRVVEPSEVNLIDLSMSQDPEGGHEFALFAHAYLADGTEVYGMPFSWRLEGPGTLKPETDNPATVSLELPKGASKALVTVSAHSRSASLELTPTPTKKP